MSLSTRLTFDKKPGVDISVQRNDATGKYDVVWDQDNDLQFADDRSHKVLGLIFERKGLWWADATRVRGSLIYTVKDDRAATPSQLESYVTEAESPLVAVGEITDLNVAAQKKSPGRIDVNVTYRPPTGNVITLRPSVSY